MVSVITQYLGSNFIETAEDIVQETLFKATRSWQLNGIPPNPEAWLYTTAKNLVYNIHKRQKVKERYEGSNNLKIEQEPLEFEEDIINDSQIKMMMACIDDTISEPIQISLILKILCGFSIKEIANAFYTSTEVINKRLVRGRKKLRLNKVFESPLVNFESKLPVLLKAIYLLFNEGYSPAQKDDVIRFDFCREAIRLGYVLISSRLDYSRNEVFALQALMNLNASRLNARVSDRGEIIDLKQQDRGLWDKRLISDGLQFLKMSAVDDFISKYFLLAAISANHCVANNYKATNWKEIIMYYDELIKIDNNPVLKLNQIVAIAELEGTREAIKLLEELDKNSDISSHYLFHLTVGEMYSRINHFEIALSNFKKAEAICKNNRDIKFIHKKIHKVVPI